MSIQRILDKLDSMDAKFGHMHSDIAQLRTEIRVVTAEIRAHELLDAERFNGLHSDVRELKGHVKETDSRVFAVEDTGRAEAITAAKAEATLALVVDNTKAHSARRHDWRKVAVGAALSLLVGAILALAATVAAGH